jgi:hypothetical protein
MAMSPRDQIAALLDQWLHFTRREARAIEAAAWEEVQKIQTAKTDLQSRLNVARADWLAAEPAPDTQSFRSDINRLIALEASNASLLASQKRRLKSNLDSLIGARRTLRRVRRCYAPAREAVLNSYS